MPVVSLQACSTYSEAEIGGSLDALLSSLGGLEQYVCAGQRVLLKPNLIAALPPERAATTHPAVLRHLATRILELGATPFIGDSPAWGGREKVGRETGVAQVATDLGLDWIVFDQKTRLSSVRPGVANGFHVDPRVLAADVIINCGKFKAHQQLGFCAALKNLYGCLPGREKALHHCTKSRTDADFARFLVAFAQSLPVQLHVVDAIVAMEGCGPRLGQPRQLGWLAASPDGVALDHVAAGLVSAPESHRAMLQAAAELGWPAAPSMQVLGTPVHDLRVDDFIWPELVGVFFSPGRLIKGWWRNRTMLRQDRA